MKTNLLVLLGLIVLSTTPAATAGQGSVINDYNGDGSSELTVYDGDTGYWFAYSLQSGQATVWQKLWGWAGAEPVPGDYDGDGLSDLAVWDQASGNWYIRTVSGSLIAWAQPWGWPGAETVSGDYDGDGKDDLAVFDLMTGNWYIRTVSGSILVWNQPWGWSGAEPVSGDYDGDGLSDLAVWDQASGNWYIRTVSGSLIAWAQPWGWPGAETVSGDYDGDGKDDLAVYDQPSGNWYVWSLAKGQALVWQIPWGWTGAAPKPGDYDGDTNADLAVFDTTSGYWYIWSVARNTTLAWRQFLDYPADISGTFLQTNILHAGAALGPVARVNEQSLGLLHGKYHEAAGYSSWWYQVVSHSGAALSDAPVYYDGAPLSVSISAVLVVDAAAEPHLFTSAFGQNISRLYRSGSNWTHEIVGAQDASSNGGILARLDTRGAFHVVMTSLDTNNNVAVIHYYSNRSGAWQKEDVTLALPAIPSRWSERDKDLAVDGDGYAHIALSLQHRPSDDVTWPGWIYYFSNRGGIWYSEIADQQSHDDWDSFFPRISLAVDAAGRPTLAAWLKYNVLTGSDALSQLIYCSRSGAYSWTRETLAETADDYFGTDGGHFTGLYPKLAVDGNGGAHIIFSDLASSHVNGYETAVVGQIRYAGNAGSGWTLSTLYRQSAAAGDGVWDKYLLVSSDGLGMDVVARVVPAVGSYIVHFSSSRQ